MTSVEKRVPWASAITEVGQDRLVTHGIDQRDIIRDFSFEEVVFFLLKGSRPSARDKDLLRAVLVAHISHGITGQSTLAVMQAADCRSDFLHALIAGFSVGAGIYHQGGLRATMEQLRELAGLPPSSLRSEVQERIERGERIMGFGHRFHRRDPRARAIIELASEHDFCGPHLKAALRLAEILWSMKRIDMNIEAAGGAVLLDLGFDPSIAHLFIVLGRSPMFAAVYRERLSQGRAPFQRIEVADIVKADG